MLELYKRIKMRRNELNMSQEELAQKLGYKSRSSINKIEKGQNDIPQSKIIDFAKALDTTPEYLMGWEENKSNDSQQINLPELNKKDERQIESDLEDMMNSMSSAAYEGKDDFEDIEAFKATIKAAMIQAKRIAKKKYTPKKYRKE